MKNLLLYSLLAVTMLIATALRSAEIIPVWNKTVEGEVQDMDFLKGQNEIIMLVGKGPAGQIQRRNPDNGELIYSIPAPLSTGSKLAITPDSMRFVQINGNGGLLRTIDDNFTILKGFDVAQEDDISIYYTTIALDPIRPYAYVTTYGWNQKTNDYAPRGKVIAYNYETGEHIKDLTPYGEYNYTAIAVSDDGKYLATLNDNKTYLKVWDLQSMEQIINEPLFDPNSNDWCEAQDIYFSKINPDLIYLSGFFTKSENGDELSGTYKFYMSNKKKERLLPNAIYASGKLTFIDRNETILLNTIALRIGVLNLTTEKLDRYGYPPKNVYSGIVRYSKLGNFFIGASNNELSKFTYDGITQINQGYDEEITISPNPTGSFVNISLNCTEPDINYQINNYEGLLLLQNTVPNQGNNLQIDFSTYPVGVYFLTLYCNNQPKTYKIIKEG